MAKPILNQEELEKGIRTICSDIRPNPFDYDSPLVQCRINKKMVAALVTLSSAQQSALLDKVERMIGPEEARPMPTDNVTDKRRRDGFVGGRNQLRDELRVQLKELRDELKCHS